MTSGTLRSALAAVIFAGFSGLALAQDWEAEPDPAILRMALADAVATLQAGLIASQHQGTPVSARFEMLSGDIRISVYTATTNGFVETVLDPGTGAVVSVEPIKDPEGLAYATAQKAAMEKASVSLLAATEQAVHQNAGSTAVGAVPELRNGQPIARVRLQRSKDLITVLEPLN